MELDPARPSAVGYRGLALAVSLGGAGYAVTALPRNSVGTAQLKKNAVVSAKVKDESLLAGDFRPGHLPGGPQGDKGDAGERGPKGDPGSARAWAIVDAEGRLVRGENVAAAIKGPAPGISCIQLSGLDPRSVGAAATCAAAWGSQSPVWAPAAWARRAGCR